VSPDDDGNWHDQQPVILASGAAALVLVALLVWAVIHTANQSSRPPEPVDLAPSSATSSTYTTKSTTSTTYTVPSVQTSQDNPVAPVPPLSTAPDDGPGDAETTTPTATIYNPYLTTTPTNAGHI
jgi:cytoskeletal protein RodZ